MADALCKPPLLPPHLPQALPTEERQYEEKREGFASWKKKIKMLY